MSAALVCLGFAILLELLHPEFVSTSNAPPTLKPALMLTPLIESSQTARARAEAKVHSMTDSYAGFITTDKEKNSCLFFWLFMAHREYAKEAPLVIWLQGGPGASGLRTVFLQHGAFRWDPDTKQLELREHAWTDRHSVLYVDNPPGTGFSFTESEEGYARTSEDAANGLLELLRQFFILFPDMRSRDFYIAGESFGGRYTIALGHAIHRLGTTGINLRGLIIVNGLVDLSTQLRKSDMAYALGLVDDQQRQEMERRESEMVAKIREGPAAYLDALEMGLDECGGMLSLLDSGYSSVSNVNYENGTSELNYEELLAREYVRQGLHVANLEFHARSTVASRKLIASALTSALPELSVLVDHYPVMVVSGDRDMCLPHLRTSQYLRDMAWSGKEGWRLAKRHLWRVGGELAGYARTFGRLTEVLVRDAGHYLSQDQCERSEDALFRFTRGLDFNRTLTPRAPQSPVQNSAAPTTTRTVFYVINFVLPLGHAIPVFISRSHLFLVSLLSYYFLSYSLWWVLHLKYQANALLT